MTEQPLSHGATRVDDAALLVNDAALFGSVVSDARRRRSRRKVVLLLSFLAAGAATELYTRMTRRRDAIRTAGAAWLAYGRCLIGSPLEAKESLETRLLRMELSLPQAAGATDTQDWPGRCATFAEQLRLAIVAPGLDRVDAGFERLRDLTRKVADNAGWTAEPSLADEIWAAARAAGLPPMDDTLDETAPRPAHPLTHTVLAALPVPFPSRGENPGSLDADRVRLRFNGPRAQATTVCVFGPGADGAPLSDVRCDDAAEAASNDRLALAGFVRTTAEHFDRFELVQPRVDAEPRVTPLYGSLKAVGLFRDQLLWVAAGHDGDELFARVVNDVDGTLGPEISLGPAVGHAHELSACRTNDALVARVRSYDGMVGARRSFAQMAFHASGVWKLAPREALVDSSARMTCRKSEGTLTWLEDDEITQTRCTAEGCATSSSGPLRHAWSHLKPLEVADLDGDVLLVGVADGSGPFSPALIHSVRMRLAPIDRIADAADVVIWGDSQHEGVDPVDARLFVGQEAAIVIVSTSDDANRAIRIDASGRFDPVHIAKN